MAPNFVFNGRSYRKKLTKTNCSIWDRGCPARLIVRDNKISEKREHNCQANRLVIQIPTTNLTPESFVDTFILEKTSQLNLYPNQIFRDLLLTMRDQFVHTPYSTPSKNQLYSAIREQRSSIGMNSIEAAMSPPLSLLPNNQPFFRRYWVGDIHGVEHKMMIANAPVGTFRTTPNSFYQYLIIMVFVNANDFYIQCIFSIVMAKMSTFI
ncbi:hypothetical protein HZS_515, partial [Henneguya salminicola]